jgi:hypothetical protein
MRFQVAVMLTEISGEKNNPGARFLKSRGDEKVKNAKKVACVLKKTLRHTGQTRLYAGFLMTGFGLRVKITGKEEKLGSQFHCQSGSLRGDNPERAQGLGGN